MQKKKYCRRENRNLLNYRKLVNMLTLAVPVKIYDFQITDESDNGLGGFYAGEYPPPNIGEQLSMNGMTQFEVRWVKGIVNGYYRMGMLKFA